MEQVHKGKDEEKVEALDAVEWEEIGREQVRRETACVLIAGQGYPIKRVSPVIPSIVRSAGLRW
jgi:hypothetical protein